MRSGIELILVFATLILAVISIIGSMAFRLRYHRKIDLEYLAWGILLGAIWNISKSDFSLYLFRNPLVAADLSVLVVMLMPLPFLFYFNEVQKGRYQKLYTVTEILLGVEFVVISAMHFLHFRDFGDNILLITNFCKLFMLLLFGTMLFDIYKRHIMEYIIVALGMLCVFLAANVSFASYVDKDKAESDVAFPAGLMILLLLAAANTVYELIDMERKRQQALAASEAKGRFLANMSHEIRTPINAVLGMDAMILRECQDVSIREYALDIQNAGQNLLALINDILDLSKIESGKLEILPEDYELSSLLHDVINMITMKAKGKNLTVDLFVDESLPSEFFGDDTRLRQILVNIMNNAVKYTEKGGVTLTVKREDAGNSDNSVVSLFFQVEDTGIGIRQEDISKLFREFERIEENRNRNIEGTGLGMSITTQLLDLMGSKLQVESVYGQGSKFYFILEQKVVNAEPIGNLGERIKKRAAEYSYQAAFTAPEAQVLVVDDNAVNRKVFKNLLKETKIAIDEAAGGMECISMVQKKKYDVIFLDHMMPDLNGIETLHRIKKLADCPCQLTPFIALTANAISGAKEMYLKEGFDSFLSKPIIPDKLEKMLLQLIPKDKIQYGEIENNASPDMDFHGLSEGSQTDSLPQIDGIDWEYALLHLKDIDILKDTVNNFYFAMEQEADELKQFFQMVQEGSQEAFLQFEVKVHAMKNNAAMIGAVPLSGVAKMLEYAAKDKSKEKLLAVTPIFLDEWGKMKEELRDYVEGDVKEEEADKPQADWNVVKEYLHQIVDSMKDMDIDTADDGVAYIKKFQYPQALMPAIEKLALAVTNLDITQAEEWSEKLENKINEMEDTKYV